jgi:TetR/AcrR family transcriptional regulator, transcriptional repressor for nem operon
VNVAWLTRMLSAVSGSGTSCEARTRAIFAAIGGAQLMVRGRADLGLFDELIGSFRDSGLIPTGNALPRRTKA